MVASFSFLGEVLGKETANEVWASDILSTVLTHVEMLPISAPAQTPFYQDNSKIIVAATPRGIGDFRVRGIQRSRLPQVI